MNSNLLSHFSIKEFLSLKGFLLYLVGVVFMPLGVVFTINAHLGAGGYDALNFAIADRLNIEVSYAIYLTAGIVVLITAAIRRQFPRLTTFITSFFLGLTTNMWKSLCSIIQSDILWIKIVIFILGLIIIAIAVAAYILSKFPTNPTDDFVVALTEKKWAVRYAKMFLDGVCVILAFVLGGEIGFGTILCTLGLGPIIDVFLRLMKKVF